jgi:GTPase involved in cell partitioning and DNA repair
MGGVFTLFVKICLLNGVNFVIYYKVKKIPQIALLGNPNSGKSSLFNLLTGLNQKVGNFPGVTVEKKLGKITLTSKETAIFQELTAFIQEEATNGFLIKS